MSPHATRPGNGRPALPAMIDIHCHLLPGLDDGARTPDMTLQMARMAVAAGTREIICTPHCTAGSPDLDRRIHRIQKAVELLNGAFSQIKLPLKLHPGMELLCNEMLPATLESGQVLPLAQSRYLLIEFSFDTPLSRIERAAGLVQQAGYIPVLAHPERYTAVWRNPDCMEVWQYAGYVLQLDKDSVLGRFGSHCARTADWALRHGVAHAVGSDAHDTTRRTIRLQTVYQALSQHVGREYARLLVWHNPHQIVLGKEIYRPQTD